MIGVFYLAIAVWFGFALTETLFPNLKKEAAVTFDGKKELVSSLLMRVPFWGVGGVLILTWATYLTAYVLKVFGGIEYPLTIANLITMTVFGIAAGILTFLWNRRRKANGENSKKAERKTLCGFSVGEIVFFSLLLIFVCRMMFLTFFIKGNNMYVGLSVFSDFAPHLGMIRSFSFSNNFPTSYSHFAGSDIRYHFLFQFLVGNLEYLGMRLDFAFNLPSIFGLFFTCVLLYSLAARLTGKKPVGYLTVLFFLFRSSPSFFRFLAKIPKKEIWKTLLSQTEFISFTEHEDWGLWNLNVYCNQRHLAFALIMQLLAILYFMPYVYRMAQKLSSAEKKTRFAVLFFKGDAWLCLHPIQSLVMGILLGCLAFFNGSVLIATCSMLFLMAAVSDHRLDYLIAAGTALILSLLESRLFVTGAVVSPKYVFGFLAENKTFFGALDYMWQLWGILLLFTTGYLLLGHGVKRYLVIVFSVPLVLAFTLSLTVDITVNHKFVMMSEMLLSVFPAVCIVNLWDKDGFFAKDSKAFARITAGCMVFALTVTGVFEYLIVERRNQKENNLVFACNDPVTMWIKENADADDIILSSYYHLNRVVLGGGMLFYGWPYYAWSAGYDTGEREKIVAQMYSARSPERLDELIQKNKIRYIIVDIDNRESGDYFLREDVIDATYEAVYTEGEDQWKFTVYDTTKKLQ